MAYFKHLKLDPNFENWLDSKILKLKAEGVIESDQEEGDSEEDPAEDPIRQYGSFQGGFLQGESEEEEGEGEWEEEVEYMWGEDPNGEPDLIVPPLPTELEESVGRVPANITYTQEPDYGMATVSTGGKIGLEEQEEFGSGAEPYRIKHTASEIDGHYYQLTWGEDEEADIFDREEHQLGHMNEHIPLPPVVNNHRGGAGGGTGVPQRLAPDVAMLAGANSTSEDHSERASRGEEAVYRHTGDTRASRGGLGGLILGVGRQDVEVAYTKLRGMAPKKQRSNNTPRQRAGPPEDAAVQTQSRKEWVRFEVHNTENSPDPRFSIGDENDEPMLEFTELGRRENRPVQTTSAEDAGSASRETCRSLPPEGASAAAGAEESVPDYPAGGSHYSNGRILLPMDTIEMIMTSDDDDGIIDGDTGSELSPDTVPIVTVDQVNLIEKWRSKSTGTRFGILAALAGGLLLVVGVVTFLVIHILSTTW